MTASNLFLLEQFLREPYKNSTVREDCQVNIGREESKAGVEQEELERFLEQLQGFAHLKVQGLMAIAPFAENPEDVRCYFAAMRELYEKMSLQIFAASFGSEMIIREKKDL